MNTELVSALHRATIALARLSNDQWADKVFTMILLRLAKYASHEDHTEFLLQLQRLIASELLTREVNDGFRT